MTTYTQTPTQRTIDHLERFLMDQTRHLDGVSESDAFRLVEGISRLKDSVSPSDYFTILEAADAAVRAQLWRETDEHGSFRPAPPHERP